MHTIMMVSHSMTVSITNTTKIIAVV